MKMPLYLCACDTGRLNDSKSGCSTSEKVTVLLSLEFAYVCVEILKITTVVLVVQAT